MSDDHPFPDDDPAYGLGIYPDDFIDHAPPDAIERSRKFAARALLILIGMALAAWAASWMIGGTR